MSPFSSPFLLTGGVECKPVGGCNVDPRKGWFRGLKHSTTGGRLIELRAEIGARAKLYRKEAGSKDIMTRFDLKEF